MKKTAPSYPCAQTFPQFTRYINYSIFGMWVRQNPDCTLPDVEKLLKSEMCFVKSVKIVQPFSPFLQ